jgi:hypothetical protein
MMVADMDHGCNDQAVPGYSIAGGVDQDDYADNVGDAAEDPHGIGYRQAGDGEIVATAERTVAHADSVALDCQTNTQVPDADSRFGKTFVPRPIEKNYATRRESCYGILVAAAAV